MAASGRASKAVGGATSGAGGGAVEVAEVARVPHPFSSHRVLDDT